MTLHFRLQCALTLAVVGMLLPGQLAHAWCQHYLMTSKMLEHPALKQEGKYSRLSPDRLGKKVKVESLEEYLAKEQAGVSKVFSEYAGWVEARTRDSKRPSRWANPFPFPSSPAQGAPDRGAFLKAARLNPEATFPLVIRIMPGGQSQFEEVPATSVNKAVSPMPTFPAQDWVQRFDRVEGREVVARDVLIIASDEPDWGFDQALWGHKHYGYGDLPYGKPEGVASQAPFHMLFRHENPIINAVAPELRDGMGIERFELFRRLAAQAFSSGHPYWGLRFTGWALHYVQDLTQPYHSKAVPHGNWLWLVKFMISSDKDKYRSETQSLAKNRHFVFEDAMGFALQQTWVERNPLQDALGERLASGMVSYGSDIHESSEKLLMAVSSVAAKHAFTVDGLVEQGFDAHITRDPAYDLEKDSDFRIRDIMKRLFANATVAQGLFNEAGLDFEQAGRGSRAVLEALLPPQGF